MQLKEWETNSTGTTVTVDGLKGGTPDADSGISPAEGDHLSVHYVKDGTVQSAASYATAYSYSAGTDKGWTPASGSTPIYWDNIAQTGNPYTFVCRYTPAATPTVGNEQDICTGIATAEYGAPLNFRMTHTMAKLTVKLLPGTGYTDTPDAPSADDKNALVAALSGRSINLKRIAAQDGVTLQADGTAAIQLTDQAESITAPYAFGAEAITSEDGITYLVAPQTLGDDCTVKLVRGDNENSYTVQLNTLPAPTASSTDSNAGTGKFEQLEPGKHYTLTLTVNETGVGFALTLAGWDNLEGSGELKPDNN